MPGTRPAYPPHQFLHLNAELGAGTYGASLGFPALRIYDASQDGTLFQGAPWTALADSYERLLQPIQDPAARRIENIAYVYEQCGQLVYQSLIEGYRPLIVSGDHSSAGGAIAGVKKAYPGERLGVIWIDAHADLHTPYTSPSGNLHGMPLATALGLEQTPEAVNSISEASIAYWHQMCSLFDCQPKVAPEDTVIIGLRSWEAPEGAVLERAGIRHYTMATLAQQAMSDVVQASAEQLAACDRIYLSFDVDSLDAALVPGTGTPVSNGLSSAQAAELLTGFANALPLTAVEFTEINPLLDRDNQTVGLAHALLHQLVNTLSA
jgi:arginase